MSGQEARANQKKEASGKGGKKSSQARSLRETVQFYMIDFRTPLGKAIDIFIILLNLLVVLLFVMSMPSTAKNAAKLCRRRVRVSRF
ncbi:hypothetical protein [Methanothrix sp.]|uniref:hypothetical protein n=1 Tax=Methanothrix sp. TaxID=90426 RepID=UPI0032974997